MKQDLIILAFVVVAWLAAVAIYVSQI